MIDYKSFAASAALAAGIIAASLPARAADIVDTAANVGSLNTLVAAVKAASLVDTLKGKGPLTVFAPTDAAFAKLPKGTKSARQLIADVPRDCRPPGRASHASQQHSLQQQRSRRA